MSFERYETPITLNKETVSAALTLALEKINANLKTFNDGFPATSSIEGVYPKCGNIGWTASFWTGILWLSYELTGEDKYRQCCEGLLPSFSDRLYNRVSMDSHDIGFIYSLSTVAGYKITNDSELLKVSLDAAKLLSERFREKGQFIQLAGGPDVEDKALYRLIIDCLMNIHLLFFAGKESGKKEYTDKAFAHFNTTMETVVRDDGSTFQNFYFDPDTGARLGGGTKQGLSDSSCWSRGQAWGVAGIPLTYSYMHNDDIIPKYIKIADYFIEHLPEDFVPYWDLSFAEGSEPRDSSAGAIAICGLLEACRSMPLNAEHKNRYYNAAACMMASMIKNYTTEAGEKSNGLLKHGTYYYAGNIGVDECCIWGDYFYMEALMRFLNPDWKKYW